MTIQTCLLAEIDWVAVKEVAIAGAAVVTAIAAYRGLDKWRQELGGRARFDSARNLARSVFKFRNAIQSCRSPMIWASEWPVDFNQSEATNDQKGAAALHVYRKRLEPVKDAVSELEAAALESEAVFGNQIEQKVQSLRHCVIELQGAIESIVRDAYAGGRDFEQDKKFGQEMRATAHASHENAANPLNKKLAAAISDIEAILKQHLER